MCKVRLITNNMPTGVPLSNMRVGDIGIILDDSGANQQYIGKHFMAIGSLNGYSFVCLENGLSWLNRTLQGIPLFTIRVLEQGEKLELEVE